MADTSLVFNILARDKTKAVFDRMRGTARVAGAAIGVALAAGALAGLEQSKVQGLLGAQLGGNPDEVATLGRTAGAIFAAGFGDDMPQVAQAIRGAVQQGLVDMDQVGTEAGQRTVKGLLTVSKVVEEESSRVSAAVTTMLRTGMVQSAEEGFDLLTRATQEGVNKAGDLIDTLEEYPTLFRSLGLDGQQALGLINQGLLAGARNADQVADGLKELGIRAIDGSTAARDAYKLLGLDADAMIAKIAKGGPSAAQGMDQILDSLRRIKDPVKQNAAGVGLLGTKWEDMRDAVLAMDLDTAAQQMSGLEGATKKAGDTIAETAGAKVDRLKRSLQQGLIETLGAAVPYIEKTFGWLSRNSSWVVPLVAGLAGLATVIYAITTAMKVWAAVQIVLNLALWTSPITWIVAGVLLLVAAIVLIATRTTWFQTAWNAAWGGIKAVFWFIVNWIVNGWKWAIGLVIAGAKAWWNLMTTVYGGIYNGAKAAFEKIGGWIDRFVGWVRALPGKIASASRGLFNGFKTAFKTAINWIIGRWNGLSFTIGGGSFMGMSIPSTRLGVPRIPYLAKGGTAISDGLAVVGERGPELLSMTKGARVTPLDKVPPGGGGAQTIVLRGDGSPFMELLLEMLRLAIKTRGGNVQVVLGSR